MPYVRDWETLEESVERLKQSGISDAGARQDICNAMADRKIAVRCMVSTDDHCYAGCALTDEQIGVPLRLSPNDFDWTASRPRKPWEGGRYPQDIDWGERLIDVLEISTPDVIRVFSLSSPPSPSYSTGLPGRPSSKHLIEGEFSRRRDHGEIAGTLAAEAEHLESWLAVTHREAPGASAKAIKNMIRTLYNEVKSKNIRAPK